MQSVIQTLILSHQFERDQLVERMQRSILEHLGLERGVQILGVRINAGDVVRPDIDRLHEDCDGVEFLHRLQRRLHIRRIALGINRRDGDEHVQACCLRRERPRVQAQASCRWPKNIRSKPWNMPRKRRCITARGAYWALTPDCFNPQPQPAYEPT